MDWMFEVQSGDSLADTLARALASDAMTGFSDDIELGAPTYDASDGDFSALVAGSYETEVTEPLDPPYEPPPEPAEPPMQPEPTSPSGPTFDYSALVDVPDVSSWLEWIGNQGPHWTYQGGGDDSLAEFLNGDWHYSIDPELLDYSGSWNDRFDPGQFNYGAYNNTTSVYGVSGHNGLIPIFREWTETSNGPPMGPDQLPTWTVIHHTEFLGFHGQRSYQLASLDDPRTFLGLIEGAMSVDDIGDAWAAFQESAQGEPNSLAISNPRISPMNGMLMAEVTLAGQFIGHVYVNDHGFRVYDRTGHLLTYTPPLPQHWNTVSGASFMENDFHTERTMSIPFAQGLLAFGATVASAGMSFLAGLGFGIASEIGSGITASNAVAYTRLMEAVYELRQVQLRNR